MPLWRITILTLCSFSQLTATHRTVLYWNNVAISLRIARPTIIKWVLYQHISNSILILFTFSAPKGLKMEVVLLHTQGRSNQSLYILYSLQNDNLCSDFSYVVSYHGSTSPSRVIGALPFAVVDTDFVSGLISTHSYLNNQLFLKKSYY